MAGNKMSSKTKSKEVGKTKTTQQDEENDDEIDFSLLRKPIMSNTTGFTRAKKIYDLATEELKGLMAKECDLLYECKVCRNIFRSLPNFISHKRVYCKEKFDERSHGHFMAAAALSTEIQKIQSLEKTYQDSLSNPGAADSDDDRIPITKDLTAVIEKLTKIRGIRDSIDDGHIVKLQKIPSSSAAVFQNVNADDDDEGSNNSMRSQVLELDRILSQDQAVMKEDGSFAVESSTDSQDVIHISDDDDDQAKLKCKICKTQFSTAKTLRFHMKYKHEASRLVFPCPDCADTFSNSWSVYRHLFKVHRKSAAQIRRLRESIQAKAFKMNNPPASYEKRKMTAKPAAKMTEEERLDQENQAWMDSMEGLGARPRCGGCGRSFERRAALRQHTATCGARTRALAATATPTTTTKKDHKIAIQIRKDYNKEKVQKAPPQSLIAKKDDAVDTKLDEDENAQCSFSKTEEKKPLEEAKMFIDDEEQNSDSKESTSPTESPEKTDDIPDIPKELADKPKIKLLFTMQAEKLSHNLKSLKQAITTRSDADIDNFTCKKCDTKCKNMVEICDHMAGHYKWMRYSCKLCNYKNYYFEKLAEHVKIVHKLKGDTDFYYSTVKAIDGTEALELMEVDDNDNESPERRPSRCSSDSSRLSDDSSNSSARMDNAKKRKIGPGRGNWKRKKEPVDKDETDNAKGSLTMDNVIKVIFGQKNQRKSQEEDEDIEISRKQVDITSAPYRRPVRNRAKRKNEDFEYDLSNLLKMEAQGYRDSSTTTKVAPTPVLATKATGSKKKLLDPQSPLTNDVISRNFAGALLSMAKRSVEVCAAHMKPFDMSVFAPQPIRELKTFARPLIPKFASRVEKISPKTTPVKENKLDECTELEILNVGAKTIKEVVKSPEVQTVPTPNKVQTPQNPAENGDIKEDFIPAVVPVNFKRESMELIKNPIVNKSLADFSKAGMKTKILVIKPLNKAENSMKRLKFQRIKLKDPTKTGTEDTNSDQIMLVKVPPVVVPKAANENESENSEKNSETETEKVSDCNGTVPEETGADDKPKAVESIENKEMEVDSEIVDTVNTPSGMEVDATA